MKSRIDGSHVGADTTALLEWIVRWIVPLAMGMSAASALGVAALILAAGGA